MSVLIEDSPRNLITWITDAIDRGMASGAVLTPWARACLQRLGGRCRQSWPGES